MKVLEHLLDRLRVEKLHMTLLDPAKQDAGATADMAASAHRAGTDAIMLGGSTGVTPENLDECVRAIKGKIGLPVILFPAGARALSPNLDAIYFMSMLNSSDPRFLAREQMHAAIEIKRMGIEPIPMGYVIVEPGMKVGEVGQAEPVRRDDMESAVRYAITAEFFGMRLVYFEAGSGAPEPMPAEMVREVKRSICIPLIVGGGIRDAEAARVIGEAGADIIVTGTVVEHAEDIERTLSAIIGAFKQ